MANNIAIKDGAAASKTLKTTDNAGVHTPHHNVDTVTTVTAVTTLGTITTMPALTAGSALIGRAQLDVGGTAVANANPVPISDAADSITIDARIATFSVSITGSTSPAYATQDNLGGLLTIANFARSSGGSGEILDVIIVSDTITTAIFDVVFYNSNPTNSTFTDNGAHSINSSDLTKIVGVAHCSDVTPDGNCSIHRAATNMPIPFVLSGTSSGYATVIVRGTPTLGGTTDVTMRVRVRQD